DNQQQQWTNPSSPSHHGKPPGRNTASRLWREHDGFTPARLGRCTLSASLAVASNQIQGSHCRPVRSSTKELFAEHCPVPSVDCDRYIEAVCALLQCSGTLPCCRTSLRKRQRRTRSMSRR